jgi:hypothetical protein
MQRTLLQTFSQPSTLARVDVSRLGTVLVDKVEAPSFAFQVLASLDSELAAPDLDRHTANTVKVLAVAISLSTPHIFGIREVLATYFACSLSMQQVSFSLDTGNASRSCSFESSAAGYGHFGTSLLGPLKFFSCTPSPP